MKKICFFVAMAALILCTSVVFATSEPDKFNITTDYSNGVTTISADVGPLYADRRVNIVILNPGFSVSDLIAQTKGAINWAQQIDLNSNGSFSVSLNLQPSSEIDDPAYTAILAVDRMENLFTKTFELYNQSYVNNITAQLKSAISCNNYEKISSLILDYARMFEIYGTSEYKSYDGFNDVKKHRAIQGIIEENPESVGDIKSAFVSVIDAILLDEIADERVYETAMLPLMDAAADSVKDEFKNLTESKKDALINSFMNMEFNSSVDIIDELYKTFILDGINSAELWTEIAAVYTKYSDALNIDTATYNNLKNKQAAMKTLIGKNFTTYENAAAAFNSAVSKQKTEESKKGGTNGGGNGGSGKNKSVSGQIVSSAINSSNTVTNEEKIVHFNDLSGYEWAEDDINTLTKAKIVNGYDENSFAPKKNVTRAEFTKMFVLAFGINGSDKEFKFKDVNSNDWFYESVKLANTAGYINGVADNEFAPDKAITREDMAVILYRYLGTKNSGSLDFADANEISDYAKDAVSALSDEKIINGYEDKTFNPKASASRAEVATLIARILRQKGGN